MENPVATATNELLQTVNHQIELLERMTGEINRYHTWHLNREQTVADHVWHVMRIYVRLFADKSLTGDKTTLANALVNILFHEDGELLTGDMQHPIKRYVPALKAVSDEADDLMGTAMGHRHADPDARAKWQIKLCDLLEMYEFATRELMSGNHGTGHAVRFRILKAVRAMIDIHPGVCVDGQIRMPQAKKEDVGKVLDHIDLVDMWTRYKAT